ncbi:MAG: hypothetical protein KH282_07410, partial [Clostridiales bacterium]|nr:hypothetical protein [Clostridiales bacterium]
NKFRIIRGNFSLIFFEKLPLIHFTVLSLPKMFFTKKHFGGPSIVIFCGANFFRGGPVCCRRACLTHLVETSEASKDRKRGFDRDGLKEKQHCASQ